MINFEIKMISATSSFVIIFKAYTMPIEFSSDCKIIYAMINTLFFKYIEFVLSILFIIKFDNKMAEIRDVIVSSLFPMQLSMVFAMPIMFLL